MTNLVHYIRAWSGLRADETPFCGSDGFLRTVAGNLVDAAGQPMQICPICRTIAAVHALRQIADTTETMLAQFIDDYEKRRPGPSINYEEAKALLAAIRKAKGDQP